MKLSRKEFIRDLSRLGTAFAIFPANIYRVSSREVSLLIQKVGNTNDEKERAKLLKDIIISEDLNDGDREIFEKLYFISDRWANGKEKYANPGSEGNEGSGYLCSFISKCKIDKFYFPQLEESNLFFPLIAFYRSRMLLANLIQNGQISMVPENRKMYHDESVRLLEIAAKKFPENKLIQAYLCNYAPWEERVPAHDNAPEWANIQRMALEKLAYLIHWWVDKRQISDGQFGGGWGDDVEMWRNWVPVLFAFSDTKAAESQEKLFEGLYGLSKMERGYTTTMNDVEHTSEEYADPLTCMLTLQPENSVWEKRALQVLDYIEQTWSGENERGQLQFKSTWFNVEEVDHDEKRSCDTPYHTRLVQPLMLIWLRTGHERVAKFATKWLKTWVEATFTAEAGKPLGIVPAAIHWPDGRPSGGKNWWEPENYHSPLYHYPSQQANMYECFLQAYYMTKDDFYLKPLRFMAEKRLQGVGDQNPEVYTAGSLEWAVSKIKHSLPEILIKYRLITGDDSFDEILEGDSKGYEKFLFDKDIDALTVSLKGLNLSLSLPEIFFTDEVRWTDRLFSFTDKYFNDILETPLPSFNANLLFSSLTGNIGNFKFLPIFGVRWLTKPEKIAVLTKVNERRVFEAELFHFGEQTRAMGARFFNLEDGKYEVQLNKEIILVVQFKLHARDIYFDMPAQQIVVLQLEKIG